MNKLHYKKGDLEINIESDSSVETLRDEIKILSEINKKQEEVMSFAIRDWTRFYTSLFSLCVGLLAVIYFAVFRFVFSDFIIAIGLTMIGFFAPAFEASLNDHSEDSSRKKFGKFFRVYYPLIYIVRILVATILYFGIIHLIFKDALPKYLLPALFSGSFILGSKADKFDKWLDSLAGK